MSRQLNEYHSGQTQREKQRAMALRARLKEKAPEVVNYDAVDVYERSAVGYRSSFRIPRTEERKKELAECGWGSKRHQPFKPLGEPILDPKVLENMRKGNQNEFDAADGLDTSSPVHFDGHGSGTGAFASLFEHEPKSPNGYHLIRRRLQQAQERLKGVKAGVHYMDLVPAANFVQEIQLLGAESMQGRAEEQDATGPSALEVFITSTPHAMGTPQPVSTPHGLGTPRNEGFEFSDSFKGIKVPPLPLRPNSTPGTKITTDSISAPMPKDKDFGSQSARGIAPQPPKSAGGRSRDSRRGSRSARAELQSGKSSILLEVLNHTKNTPLDPAYSVANTKKDFQIVKKSTTEKLEADLEQMEEERPSTFRRKYTAMAPDRYKASFLDTKSELVTIRLKADREKYMHSVRYNSKNQWFVGLLSMVHQADRQLTHPEEHFMHLMARIVEEGVSITQQHFYGLLRMLPIDYHASPEFQKILTYIRQEHLKISPADYRTWLISNGFPVPDAVQLAASRANKGRRRRESIGHHNTPTRPNLTQMASALNLGDTPRAIGELSRGPSAMSNYNS